MIELCDHLLSLWLEHGLCRVYSDYVDHLSLQLFSPRMFPNVDLDEPMSRDSWNSASSSSKKGKHGLIRSLVVVVENPGMFPGASICAP